MVGHQQCFKIRTLAESWVARRSGSRMEDKMKGIDTTTDDRGGGGGACGGACGDACGDAAGAVPSVAAGSASPPC